ncbi:MAG: hypothetical protein COT06_10395 [Syntrophobacteraceae bacterium CG07_land_8_20_14_0_80_61_8]|nr:MAG: hypothetical protein COT06_10395 [Syntrophobacteraceae bacterium CG07_land_8_20_14_0_80_61_8]
MSITVASVWVFGIGCAVLVAAMIGLGRHWRGTAAGELRVVLTGGGTGGHVNPALAIAESIRECHPEVKFLYIGVAGKAESVIVGRSGHPLRFVSSAGFPGLRPSFRLAVFIWRLGLGMLQALFILARFGPRWLIATGGYVSAPAVLVTVILGRLGIAPTRVFLHEQNSVPGQLNALMGRWVHRVLLTFPQTQGYFPNNGVVVGYPVRHSIVLKDRDEALAGLDFQVPAGARVVFVFGGSQGARTINRALTAALRELLTERGRLFIIHGVGLAESADYDAVADTEAGLERHLSSDQRRHLDGFYYRQRYFHNIADIYSISDLIVCRSGAGSLNEISRLGKPALLIPKSNLPGDHQVMNARAMKQAGAAEILFEETVFEGGETIEKVAGEVLAERILGLLRDPEKLAAMAAGSREFLRRRANERILSELHGDRSCPNGIADGARNGIGKYPPLLNNHRLLQVLRTAYGCGPDSYDPGAVIPDPDDLTYYRHRAEGLLADRHWSVRNLGVKLVGLTHYREKTPTLLQMLSDRTPVAALKRALGGDFEQVGFIRRNIVEALRILNRLDSEVEAALLKAISDPYYEVRAQVCRAVAHFGPTLAGKRVWHEALRHCLGDRSFEVVVAAARALGEIGVDGRTLEALLELREHHQWQVRNGALHGIMRLFQRCVVVPSTEVLAEVDRFILTAPDFQPDFLIDRTYRAIAACAGARKQD